MPEKDFCLKDKVAIVTGGTKGIGRGIAEAMAKAGAKIVVVSRSRADCDKTAQEIGALGVEALSAAADVTKMENIQNVIQATLANFGRVDVLVNNAGAALPGKAENISEEEWDKVLNLDLKAAFFFAQAAGRQMIVQKRGKIINISSMWGLVAYKMFLPYCVAKGGVMQMTRALALEWARYNIQVNTICPGYILTDLNRDQLENEQVTAELMRKIPAKRYGSVGDVAGAAVFLASDASDYMTGAHMSIDGGWTAE